MTRFLAVVRRFFLACSISLLLCIFVFGVKISDMWEWAKTLNSVKGYFSILFMASPVLFLLLTIISVIYIRRHGQFAEFHKRQSPVITFFRCLGHDILSPFKNIKDFFVALFSKKAIGRNILIMRFAELVLIVLSCACGVYTLVA